MSSSASLLRGDRERLQRRLEGEFRSGTPVRKVLDDLTNHVDQVVRDGAGRFLTSDRTVVMAIGGYGRRELFPGSDVDLLVVHQDQEAAVSRFLTYLWDAGLHLGHQVWTWEEFENLDLSFLEFVLALLDARALAGDKRSSQRILDDFLPDFLSRHREELVQSLLDLTDKRHRSFRKTVYQLEPDLKNAPGGLRDYRTGLWLRRLLDRRAFLTDSDADLLEAYKVICRLRMQLHFQSGKRQDRLTHGLQGEAAEALGYAPGEAESPVERMMHDYFVAAHRLVNFCRRQVWDADPDQRSKRLPPRSFDQTPAGVVSLFLESLQTGCPLAEETRNQVAQVLRELPAPFTRQPDLLKLLRRLMTPRPGLYRTLCEMYELGVLERLLPEFGLIRERVIRDFYHCFTVDEHSLQAVKALERLMTTKEPAEKPFRGLLKDTRRPDLLVWALLLHDVGKSRIGEHSRLSAQMASGALQRIGLERFETQRVIALIEQHLDMSAVVFRRDLDDPSVVEEFADQMRDVEQLRMLCLLTFADIQAVGPGILTDWKKKLLFQLFVASYNHLTQGYGSRRIEGEGLEKQLLEELPDDIDKGAYRDFLEGFPRRYLSSTTGREILQHYRMATRLSHQDPVQIRVSRQRDSFELCIITPDRRGLFANIVGALVYYDMNIQRGYGFANRRGLVLDLFRFSDAAGRFSPDSGQILEFQEFLRRVLTEEESVEQALEKKRRSPLHKEWPQVVEPLVRFVDRPEAAYTILEIVAPDSLGLLYRIGRVLSAAECVIELLLIATEGSKAVDVFYLTHQGRALDSTLRDLLPKRLLKAIEDR